MAALVAMTLIATLKLSFTRRLTPVDGKMGVVGYLTHPLWLWPLVLMVPFVIGAYLKGTLSPWPPLAFEMAEGRAGMWAGLLAALSTATIDLWLFWTAASALISFTNPLAPIYPPIPREMHKYYHLVNAAAGLFVVVKAMVVTGALHLPWATQ
jgi:hypothetical protein